MLILKHGLQAAAPSLFLASDYIIIKLKPIRAIVSPGEKQEYKRAVPRST